MIRSLPWSVYSRTAINVKGEARAASLPKIGRLRFAHRSGVPSGLSRFASQAKPLLTIAEPLGVFAFISAVVLVAVLI